MKNRIIICLLVAVFLVTNAEITNASINYDNSGAEQAVNSLFYYEADGSKFVPSASGVFQKDGKYYYFNADGSIYQASGKTKVNGRYYYFNKDNSLYVDGWKTINEKKNYFTKEGAAEGWKKIDNNHYYFSESADLQTNKIVGKYYVNKKGQRVTDKAAIEAVKIVKKVSKDKKNNTNSKKLRACYNIIKKYPYKRVYEDPLSLGKNWPSKYAYYFFSKKQGNCYKYASAFAYCAEVLGYDARVAVGRIWSSPHGWTEIKINGKIYTYDPNMQRNNPGINSYKRTYKTVPYPYHKRKSVDIKL